MYSGLPVVHPSNLTSISDWTERLEHFIAPPLFLARKQLFSWRKGGGGDAEEMGTPRTLMTHCKFKKKSKMFHSLNKTMI